jgi:predicted kinase
MFLNRYLELTGDYEGLRVFRFYQVYRALVRAKVAGLRLAQLEESGVEEEKAKSELIGYLKFAQRFISCASPALILMHGVSGSGKTTVSTEIVKIIGAIRVRSDVERKRLFAETLKPKNEEIHDPGLYHSDMAERTYDRLQGLARILLCAGFSVVVDATVRQPRQREAFRVLANEQACACFIFDVFAPEAVLAERIEWRSQEGRDASDATVEIMERQQETEEPLTQAEQPHLIRADSTDPQAFILAIRELKEKQGLELRGVKRLS